MCHLFIDYQTNFHNQEKPKILVLEYIFMCWVCIFLKSLFLVTIKTKNSREILKMIVLIYLGTRSSLL
jgi:hypothetical protein